MIENHKNYIKWMRSKVGHETIILNFVGGCIRNSQGEVLLQRRSDKNKWGFPGGAIELGESATTAVKREVKEETGLDVDVCGLIGIYTDYYDEYPNGDRAQTILIFLDLTPVGGILSNDADETLELRYFSLNQMPPLVNRQHEDALKDIKEYRYGVIR